MQPTTTKALRSAVKVFASIILGVLALIGAVAVITYLSWQIGWLVALVLVALAVAVVVFLYQKDPGDPGL